jgi:hypothetical protein
MSDEKSAIERLVEMQGDTFDGRIDAIVLRLVRAYDEQDWQAFRLAIDDVRMVLNGDFNTHLSVHEAGFELFEFLIYHAQNTQSVNGYISGKIRSREQGSEAGKKSARENPKYESIVFAHECWVEYCAGNTDKYNGKRGKPTKEALAKYIIEHAPYPISSVPNLYERFNGWESGINIPT